VVEIESPLASPHPLQGYLRRANHAGRTPAVICCIAATETGCTSTNVGASGSRPGAMRHSRSTALVRAASKPAATARPAISLPTPTAPCAFWRSIRQSIPHVSPQSDSRGAACRFSRRSNAARSSKHRRTSSAPRLRSTALRRTKGRHDGSHADPDR
jgi:hypothetical protein